MHPPSRHSRSPRRHGSRRCAVRLGLPCRNPRAGVARCAGMAPARRPRRRHDADAGGDPALLAAKAALRDEVWTALTEARVARFPGARNRISNFVGAEAAAERLRATREWARAATLKANPDSAQLPVRQRALEDGRTVYMAVPRLAEPEPFFLLDPAHLADPPRKAASIAGASRSARRVSVAELEPVDLVVTGCVAVGGRRPAGQGRRLRRPGVRPRRRGGIDRARHPRGDDRARAAGAPGGRDPDGGARRPRRPRRHPRAGDRLQAPPRTPPDRRDPLGGADRREDRRDPPARRPPSPDVSGVSAPATPPRRPAAARPAAAPTTAAPAPRAAARPGRPTGSPRT